jgi:hypothetical protein
MNTARDLVFSPVGHQPTSQAPLASWYTQGVSDGLGDRLLMFDNTSTGSLELLRFRPDLAAAPGFERALRASVDRLVPFGHRAFSRVRAVERLEGDDALTLVSVHTPGRRLSEMLQWPQRPASLHPAFVVRLIRWLVPALADLHQDTGVAHGVLTADRIVLTPGGQLVIVEHVLGQAIEHLRLPANRLWHDFGIIVPPGASGVPRLDVRADVVQLALAALSLLLGRRVTPDEYPQKLERLLDEFAIRAGGRASSLVPPLRQWLERALQVEGGGFESALDAHDGLRELPESAGPLAIEPLPETTLHDPALAAPVESAPLAEPPPGESGSSPGAVVLSYPTPPAGETVIQDLFPAEQTAARLDPAILDSRFPTPRNLTAGLALLALVEAVAIAGLLITRPSGTVITASVPVRVESPGPGDIVMVDGQQVGVTPLELNLGASTQTITVVSREVPPAAAGPIATEPPEGADAAARAIAQAAARQRSGGLRLVSPIELQVLEGERVLGSSADGPIVTTAGIHQLDLVNTALGYRSRQTVEIKRGEIVSLTVQPPDGRVSINALPWAQVWIDGAPVGETPLANLSVPAGEREITFRHPQLGERRETLLVKSGTETRVSATFDR